ncbi:LOW QUALITY PROTEIN: X-box-binding protein 1 [Haliaeetus albicilla]|uniref:LOW QUALITY PROTEIN: X-box-binding protein 1 n=1 Tax=Haliaeetus leucocephalus TaxID=52644 RepID=UPI00053CC884|nr:PREDICTED: LOW QUALITY PROTEIN: X-box-binding protein 1 [Haliaeetus leucocephalus]
MAALPGAAAPRLLLIPSKAAEPPGPAAGRHISVVLPVGAAASSSDLEAPQPARKRQRLTHLSPEEKALRRKLKNRVAAQSARDRKKARMTELEQQVVELEEENQKLLLENRLLREKTCSLALENQELRCRLGLNALKMEEESESEVVKESQVDEIRLVTGSAERSTQTTCSSAAGAGPAVTISDNFHMDSDGSDSSDSESDLLLGFLDSLDPEMFFKYADSESTCLEKLEEEICGETNSIPTSPSPSLGSPSAKLEAINELIRFDHVYTKPLILEIPVKMGNQTNMLVKIEEVSLSPSEDKAVPKVPVSVKEEPVDSFMPELGISHLLSSHHSLPASSYLLDACSDSGYEGSLSPFSDMSSPLDTDHAWEDSFANELFPQLISV